MERRKKSCVYEYRGGSKAVAGKHSGLTSLLTKTNNLLQVKIKENVGKEGAVFKTNAGECYSGYGEEEGREFVAKAYHEIVNGDR